MQTETVNNKIEMKIIHTADWHLGDSFHGYDRIAEHEHFLHWLEGVIADERPDALLVAGDVFDNANPSAQAEEMFFRFLAQATALHRGMRIIITAGNHDSGRRLQAPSEALRPLGVEIRGVVEHDEKNHPLTDNLIIPVGAIGNREVQAVVIAVPYLRTGDIEFRDNLSRSVREFVQDLVGKVRRQYGREMPIVLMAHLYAAGAEIAQAEHSERLVVGGEDCIDARGIDTGVDYVALGHIHKAQQVGGTDKMIFYAGSPLPMSFSEKGYSHGVNMLTIGAKGGAVVDRLEYKPMRNVLSMPDKGSAPLSDILSQIRALPKADKVDSAEWPYVEIRLKENEPAPNAQSEIVAAMQDRAATLCRLVREVPQAKESSRQQKMQSLDQLRNISPLDIAHDAYLTRTGREMSDELVKRFKQAAEMVGS